MRCFAVAVSIILLAGTAESAELFNDGFEGCTNGNACSSGTGWDSETDSGTDMEADTDLTPLAGSCTCLQLHNDTTTEWVEEDVALSTETEIWVRFYFYILVDPTWTASQTGNYHSFVVQNEADSDTEGGIRFRGPNNTGLFTIRSYVEEDSGSERNHTIWGVGMEQWNCFEMRLRASSGAGADDGIMESYLNGRHIGSYTDVDNDTGNFGEVRLGAVFGLDSGVTMTFHFDAFVVDDADRIGCTLGMPAIPQVTSGMMSYDY